MASGSSIRNQASTGDSSSVVAAVPSGALTMNNRLQLSSAYSYRWAVEMHSHSGGTSRSELDG